MPIGNERGAEEAREVNSLENPIRKRGESTMGSNQKRGQRGRAGSLSGRAHLPTIPLPHQSNLCLSLLGFSLIPYHQAVSLDCFFLTAGPTMSTS